jgi:hypothetical protein
LPFVAVLVGTNVGRGRGADIGDCLNRFAFFCDLSYPLSLYGFLQ